ncbi:MAG: ATP-dependent DNA helicase RecG [Hespellia sp.]|nr:ATP-dependent DNA helicase RecG [Hespellia sp.]
MREESQVNELKGVGAKTQEAFAKLGIVTIGDLLRHFPREYDVYEDPVLLSEIEEGKIQTVTGAVYGRVQVSKNRNLQVTTLTIRDITGALRIIWFRMPYLRSTLPKSGVITLRGRIVRKKQGLVMEHPEIFYPSALYGQKQNTLQPVYPLTSGITNNAIMKAMRQAFDLTGEKTDILPEQILSQYRLSGYNEALRGIHFPKDKEEFYAARERMVFEEFLIFLLGIRKTKEENQFMKNQFLIKTQPMVGDFIKALPYELTHAQKRVYQQIQEDLFGEKVMARLIQGDVGSGKTIVALLALMLVGLNGYQGALMAPTEVLANQHYLSISRMLHEYHIPLTAALLTGSMTARKKREVYERIASGESQIIIGTHALIQEKASYRNLALVVTDEQHRFGVKQREMLAGKGNTPHILVMSATPIPRSLAVILYGDLDISVIDELPANRLPIKNCVVDTGYRKTAYEFMRKQVAEGRQCYVICPMVEESETLEVENVTDYAQMLQEELGDEITVGILHGKMKQKQKDEIMETFKKNEIQILVSTTVIEVGIDVPNSTVMLIENAERFGLAQLHQLRGRVGRGKYQSYCIFMSSSKSKETKQRLDILNHSNDGFQIASEDLKLRGPGDIFGIRQSGVMQFTMADIYQDAGILERASEAARQLVQEDPELTQSENQRLGQYLEKFMQNKLLETTL